MPDDAGSGEKSEDPTPKKIRDARMEGQVVFSTEVNTAEMLIIGFSALLIFGPMMYRGFGTSVQQVFSDRLTVKLDAVGSMGVMTDVLFDMGFWPLVFMGVIFLVALLSSLGQIGLVLTGKPLVPKFSRVSPMQGLKRTFGLRGLMRFVFSLLKLTIIVSIAWIVIQGDLFSHLYFKEDIAQRFHDKVWTLIILAIKLAAVLSIIAFFDFLYQRYQHTKDLMMTKQEVKEEYKQSEGDPLLKGKIRQIQREMAQQRMMAEVPDADVVITNPTHVAVALKYDPTSMAAPVVIAKGYDHVAQRIKAIAKDHNITMVENVPLTRGLAKKVDIGHPVPTDFYKAVAEVLSYVYQLEGRTAGAA